MERAQILFTYRENLTYGTQAVVATKQVTAVIPIVFALPGDPVGTGLVASLARPGGNVTGLSSQTSDLATKRLELLREIVPGLRRTGDPGQCRKFRQRAGHALVCGAVVDVWSELKFAVCKESALSTS